jgi:hypothetical protein
MKLAIATARYSWPRRFIRPSPVFVVQIDQADTLQLVEGRARQSSPFPANFQPPIRKVIDVDHFAAKANGQALRLKRQLHAAVLHHQLVRHLTLLAPAQNFIQILPGIQQTMEVLVASRELGKATVLVGDEAGQKRVCRLDRVNASESQFLHQAILQRMMSALDATLRLAGIGARNLEFRQRPPELGHSTAAGRVLVAMPHASSKRKFR